MNEKRSRGHGVRHRSASAAGNRRKQKKTESGSSYAVDGTAQLVAIDRKQVEAHGIFCWNGIRRTMVRRGFTAKAVGQSALASLTQVDPGERLFAGAHAPAQSLDWVKHKH